MLFLLWATAYALNATEEQIKVYKPSGLYEELPMIERLLENYDHRKEFRTTLQNPQISSEFYQKSSTRVRYSKACWYLRQHIRELFWRSFCWDNGLQGKKFGKTNQIRGNQTVFSTRNIDAAVLTRWQESAVLWEKKVQKRTQKSYKKFKTGLQTSLTYSCN